MIRKSKLVKGLGKNMGS